mgnify:FL=1|jgi:hypothetical protein
MDIEKLEELLKDAGDVISEQQLRIRELEQYIDDIGLTGALGAPSRGMR